MKPLELLIVAAIHMVAFTVALLIVVRVKPDMPELALVMAAVCGTYTGAMLSRRRGASSRLHKAQLGGVMAVLCVAEGVLAQVGWHVMAVPEVALPIAAIGTFVFPFVLFNTARKSLRADTKLQDQQESE